MMLPISWEENFNGNFMKQNNNLKAIILLLSIVYVLFLTQVTYAKYLISKNFDINANSAKFSFDVISKEESETIKFNDNKAEFNLLIKNNDGTNFNTFDTSYEIKLLNNDKYTFSVGNISDTNGILIQNLKGNELLNEDVTIIFQPKANADVKLVENLQINIKVIGPYIESKEYKFPLTIIENKAFSYNYSGATETFSAPLTGKYKVELWGAEGGAYTGVTSGKGAYTSGIIELSQNETLNVTIGGKGSVAGANATLKAGGFNGGGGTYYEAGTGGGASDIRYGGTTLNDRIMVAAGAGGSGMFATTLHGGSGGTFVGSTGGNHISEANPNDNHAGTGGTQISGGIKGVLWTGQVRDDRYQGEDGTFGNGGRGGYEGTGYFHGAGAGGGGYYGGGRRN